MKNLGRCVSTVRQEGLDLSVCGFLVVIEQPISPEFQIYGQKTMENNCSEFSGAMNPFKMEQK